MTATKLSRLAILATLAACLQISAGFFPGIGHLLSIFCTVPIILAGLSGVLTVNITFFTATLIIFFIQPPEAPIFLFTTGLLGLIIGYGLNSNWNKLKLIVYSSIGLGIGIHILSLGLNIPIMGGWTKNLGLLGRPIFIFIFSLAYSYLWSLFLPQIQKLFYRVN
ncbi:hypothetical protein [Halanaerobaculum tunisiense]